MTAASPTEPARPAEHGGSGAPVQKVGPSNSTTPFIEKDQAFRLWIWEWPEQHCIGHREDRAGRPDGEREQRHRGDAERRRSSGQARGVPQVAPGFVYDPRAQRVAIIF